jgi:branched-chain amino acid transport system permease protein
VRPSRAVLAFALAALALGTFPWLGLPDFYITFLYLVFHWVTLATSWNILSGYSGYFSFGQGAFFGAGVYTAANLLAKVGVNFLWAVPASGAVAALLGLGVGLVVFRLRRLRGELFALLTLAVAFVLDTIVKNTPIDGGPGVFLAGVPTPAIFGDAPTMFYLSGLTIALACVLSAYLIYHARLGAGLFAIRDDEDVAEAMGVPTFRYKMIVLAVSAFYAGLAGGVYAVFVIYVTPQETFSTLVPLFVILMSVLGGSRTWFGPSLGALVMVALLQVFVGPKTAAVSQILIGTILIVLIVFVPEGLAGRALRWRRRRLAAA